MNSPIGHGLVTGIALALAAALLAARPATPGSLHAARPRAAQPPCDGCRAHLPLALRDHAAPWPAQPTAATATATAHETASATPSPAATETATATRRTGTPVASATATASATSATTPPALSELPPAAELTFGGERQEAGIGTFCWWPLGLCVDYAYLFTPQEPIALPGAQEVTIRLPVERPPTELDLHIFQVTEQHEVRTSRRERAWRLTGDTPRIELELDLVQEQTVEVELGPGLHAWSLGAFWGAHARQPGALGDVHYGFLTEVAP